MNRFIDIEDFDYHLNDDRIAKFPLSERDRSKLLIYRNGNISHSTFRDISNIIEKNSLIICNNTRVIHARLQFFRASGARIEIFCLEPYLPADHERAFADKGNVRWICMVGNLKKWKERSLSITFDHQDQQIELTAERVEDCEGKIVVEFSHNWLGHTFGEILELCGTIPIPPYLNRDSVESDNSTYQTLYSKYDGSVAAPTAGLHFTQNVFELLRNNGCEVKEVTLHVGAGTFLPVKSKNAAEHAMHTEHFDFTIDVLKNIVRRDHIVAVGTTSVRTIESIAVLGYRVVKNGTPDEDRVIGQWEAYDTPNSVTGKQLIESLIEYMERNNLLRMRSSTQIMITPVYKFKVINCLVTNFHQPKSTLLLLISAIVGQHKWREVYDYALEKDFRFLSYGDSSILFLDSV